jgi:hypothetical protein
MENSNEKSDSSGMRNNIDNTYNENNSSENNDIDSGIFYGSKIEIIDKSLESQKNEKIISISKGPNNETEKFKNLEKKIDEENDNEPFKPISAYSGPDEHFFCQKCHLIPTIRFMSINDVIYSCGCHEDYEEKINKFLENTIVIIKDKIKDNNNLLFELNIFYCKEHKGEKYCYYCEMCKDHLCRKCVREKNEHKDHCILIFDQSMNEIDKKIKFINDKFSLNTSFFTSNSSDFLEKDEYKDELSKGIIELISVVINDYNSYTNYTHFQIISNFAQFLDQTIKTKETYTSDLDLEEKIKIFNRRDLLKFINKPELIIAIEFSKNNLFDITQLCKANLINLKSLKLRENNISNIEPLVYAKFKNIREIDLSVNKLGNQSIKYFSQLDFSKLYYINLFANFFSDFNFFQILNNKNLKELHCLYIGSNKFIDKGDNIKFDASNLTEIGLSNGIFNDKSIRLINNFSFNNLEILFLYSNDISSLSFINNLELPKIKQFWINSNFIEEYYPLCKYKTLEKIMIRNNYIKNIDNLVSFVETFKKLETLDISGNNIDLNDKDNEDILLEVRGKVNEFKYY